VLEQLGSATAINNAMNATFTITGFPFSLSGWQQKGGEFSRREGTALREVRRHDCHPNDGKSLTTFQ
jgi:hypothetical protein